MANNRGNETNTLKQSLINEADQFEFHAIVKILERIKPNTTPLGEGVDPIHEPLRIQTHVSMDFPTTDVNHLKWSDDPEIPSLLTTNFLNIAGVQGPLPTPYTQLLIERNSAHDSSFQSFLDIFNHRLISLFHRIRKKYWIGVSPDEPENTMAGKSLKALLGLAGDHMSGRLKIPDRSLLYYSGILWQQPRSVAGLIKILESFFRLPIRITQLEGRWIHVPLSQQTTIGKKSRFNVLGKTAIVGKRFWEQQADFTIHIGPAKLDYYINLLKPGPAYIALTNIVSYYVGTQQDFKINLILEGLEKPLTRLGLGMALGWTSWLNNHSKPSPLPDYQNIMTLRPFKAVPGRYKL